MSLHDVVKELVSIAVSQEAFGEEVAIKEPGKTERNVWCTIESANTLRTGEYINAEVERISVRLGRDEASVQGGIAEPAYGTTLRKAGDAVGREFVFTGEIVEKFPHWMTLVFERTSMVRVGLPRRQ